MILGIDEVGRGCWAGPLCVGAVVLDDSFDRTDVRDSKLTSGKKRASVARRIRQDASAVGLGWASAKFIDTYGLTQALRYAAQKAVNQIAVSYDEIVLDGTVNFLPDQKVTLLKKADQLIPAVSAASIVAKVARDTYMGAIDSHFAGYGFGKHVGYGTAQHRRSLDQLGPSKLHRMSFAPLATFMPATATTKVGSAGSHAEELAATFLEEKGYRILARNWKTRWCEIDIIAQKANITYFVEVKYRVTNTAGRGLDYITPNKRRRMTFAAELWRQQQKATNPCQLAALELSGPAFTVTAFVENIV